MVNITTRSDSNALKFLTMEQVRELISSIKDARDKLIVRMLYETACTIRELAKIKVCDIAGNRIKIQSEDGLRFPRISGNLSKGLSLYIRGNRLGKDDFVLSTRQSSSISEKRIAQLIKKYSSALGEINAHYFRYYHVAHAYTNGVFIENISEQLGLTKLRVFQVLDEFNVSPKQNNYNNFLGRI